MDDRSSDGCKDANYKLMFGVIPGVKAGLKFCCHGRMVVRWLRLEKGRFMFGQGCKED